jgi:DNA polymerase III epsilon subunit-like protein
MERWIALDLETTGLSPTRHEIRELAAVPFGIDEHAEHVLRFTRADFQPSTRLAARTRFAELLEMLGEGSVLVAHNAAFDLAFLAEALRRARLSPFVLRAYCTLRLARILLPDLPRYDLVSLREALRLETGKPHVALADARAVAALFMVLVERAGFLDEQALRGLHGPPLRVGASSAHSRIWSDSRRDQMQTVRY